MSWKFIGYTPGEDDVVLSAAPEENMLTVIPNRRMHKAEVQCTVEHEALNSPLTSDVHLNVEFPPGKPTMKLIDADCSDDEVSNKKVKLVCEDNDFPANPP